MARTKKVITVSLPPDLEEKINQLAKEEGMSRSELLEKALRRYIDEHEWKKILKYGQQRAKEMGIREEDVERLIDECRV